MAPLLHRAAITRPQWPRHDDSTINISISISIINSPAGAEHNRPTGTVTFYVSFTKVKNL